MAKPVEAICHPSPYSRALWSCTQHPSEQLKLWHVPVPFSFVGSLDSGVFTVLILCESGLVPLAFLVQMTLRDTAGLGHARPVLWGFLWSWLNSQSCALHFSPVPCWCWPQLAFTPRVSLFSKFLV